MVDVYGAIAIANTIAYISEGDRSDFDIHRVYPAGLDGAGLPLIVG